LVSANSDSTYPQVVGTKGLVWIARILEYPLFSTGAVVTTGLLPWVSVFMGWVDKPTHKNILLGTSLAVLLVGVFIPPLLRLSRYALISREIRRAVTKLPIRENTLLIGAGGGSFKAIGMLLKAWEEEKAPNNLPPDSLCVSMACKDGNTRSFYPSLDEIKTCVRNEDILIVLAQIGTGSTAQALLSWADSLGGSRQVNLFSLIVSETAAQSGDWRNVYTLGIINRRNVKHSILPWVSTRDEY
jgi:hypothetical protein